MEFSQFAIIFVQIQMNSDSYQAGRAYIHTRFEAAQIQIRLEAVIMYKAAQVHIKFESGLMHTILEAA